jgi:Bacterial Ig-like domain (group 3)/FG-GAP-like repeat/FG-GAP repeat
MFTKSWRFVFLALDRAKTIRACTNPANWRNHIKWRRNGAQLSLVFLLLSWVPAAAGLQATNTTLVVTVAGTAATTAASGSAVQLIATVTTTGPTPTAVTPGQVQFCDASAKSCFDAHLVGTAQLTKDGTARFTFIPSHGSHSYKAVFVGTTTYAGSLSGPAALTVTGLNPTVTTATWSGTATGYTLTATVGGAGRTAPTGKVSFLDATDGNTVLSTVDLTPGAGGLAFSNPYTTASPLYSYSVAVGDFNGDGIPDLALAPGVVRLGNGDGTFGAAALLPGGGFAIAAADVNDDGKLDLVVLTGDFLNNAMDVTTLLGNGDGTFVAGPSMTIVGGRPVWGVIAVADFNGDGIPDVALTGGQGESFLLLGKGDGSFVSSPLPDVVDLSMVVGDFNKDGISDLVMTSGALLLGKGDGTFQASTAPIPAGAWSIAVGDFNGDGNPDLMAIVPGESSASGSPALILLGAGDGTFPTTVTDSAISVDPGLGAMTVGDFNGDGILDLAAAGSCCYFPTTVTIWLGDGTAHFTLSSQFTAEYGADFLLSADLNGDGLSDLLMTVTSAHELNPQTLVFMPEKQTATATAEGITLSAVAPVPHQAFASYAGDDTYKPGKSGVVSVGAGQRLAMLFVSSSANPVSAGDAVTLTAMAQTGPPMPTGSVEFFEGNSQLGTGAFSNGAANVTLGGFTAGWHLITASYPGDSNYAPASLTFVLEVIGTAASSVTLSPSATTITDRQPLTVNITVNGTTGQPGPTGIVSLAFASSSGLFLTAGTVENGTASVNIPAGTLGSGPNVLTVGYLGDPVYGVSSATTTIIVSPLVIAIPPPSAVAPGASMTATATLQAGSTFSGTVDLTCTLTGWPGGAQSLPTCTLNPANIALTPTGTGTTVVTVKTTAATSGALLRPRLLGIGAGGTVLICILLAAPLRRRWSLVGVLFLVFGAGMIACGGGGMHSASGSNPGSPATTAGTYIFTLAGTDPADATTKTQIQFTVTVQ